MSPRAGAAILMLSLMVAAVSATPATAQSKCALVNVGLLPGFSEPERRCFRLDMVCPVDSRHGCFKSTLEFEDGWVASKGERLKRLKAPFGYIDADGIHWDVPAGALTDGASIPLFFQLFIGGPWTDSYLRAAVLHDFYIRRATANASAVHKLFHNALLASGVASNRAAQMYLAVDYFGPRWKSVDVTAVDAMWQNRKAALAELTRLHQRMWEAHQEIERQRAAQAAVDRAILARPLKERTRVFLIGSAEEARRDFERFVEAAERDRLVHAGRDGSLIATLREQLDAELRRPATERDNVIVLRFMRSGLTSTRFQARNQAELAQILELDEKTSVQLDEAVMGPEQPARR